MTIQFLHVTRLFSVIVCAALKIVQQNQLTETVTEVTIQFLHVTRLFSFMCLCCPEDTAAKPANSDSKAS